MESVEGWSRRNIVAGTGDFKTDIRGQKKNPEVRKW